MLNSSDILRGYTDTIILAQLAGGDSYGYVISKNVQEITRGELQLKEATLYTTFRRLESAGVIESRSSGMKGTYIKVLNDVVFDEIAKLKQGEKR